MFSALALGFVLSVVAVCAYTYTYPRFPMNSEGRSQW